MGKGRFRSATVDEVLAAARVRLRRRLRRVRPLYAGTALNDHLSLLLGALEYEAFYALFLDTQNQLISEKLLFRGSATQVVVYPREVVKEALAANASAVILAHNHPSQSVEVSAADLELTDTIRSALALVDVRLVDHMVVAGQRAVSVLHTRPRPP